MNYHGQTLLCISCLSMNYHGKSILIYHFCPSHIMVRLFMIFCTVIHELSWSDYSYISFLSKNYHGSWYFAQLSMNYHGQAVHDILHSYPWTIMVQTVHDILHSYPWTIMIRLFIIFCTVIHELSWSDCSWYFAELSMNYHDQAVHDILHCYPRTIIVRLLYDVISIHVLMWSDCSY